MTSQDFKAKVKSNRQVAPGIFKLSFDAEGISAQAKPGQFVHVKCGNYTDPLLRRPFSINNIEDGEMQVLYQVKGLGTRMMSALGTDDFIDVIGPFGKGFNIPDNGRQKCLIVAGGIGIAPMHFLVKQLAEKGHDAVIAFGCISKGYVQMLEPMEKFSKSIFISTDDGSAGKQGLVTDIDIEYSFYDKIFSCGPEAMLEKVSQMASAAGVDCEVSLERHMACGIGACLGCVCEVKPKLDGYSNYSRVCMDGPVYNAKVVKW